MRIKENTFYFRHGLLKAERMTQPRLIPLPRLGLPLESIYHFFEDNGAVVGPNPNDLIIRSVINDGNPRVFVEHITRLQGTQGNPRRTPLNPITMEAEFRRKNRQFRPLRQDKALLINNRNLLVCNYNMLNPLYRYIASFRAGYFRWHNNMSTFWQQVNDNHARFGWNQYIDLTLPHRLPKHSEFTLMANGATQENLKRFNTASLLNIFDLFQWLGKERDESLLAQVSPEAYSKINFVIRVKTHWLVLNMGMLNSWRLDPEAGIEVGLQPLAIRRKFWVLIQGLVEFNNGLLKVDYDKEGEAFIEIRDPEEPVPVPATTQAASDSEEVEEGEEEGTGEVESDPDAAMSLPGLDLSMDIDEPTPVATIDTKLEVDNDDEVVTTTPDAAEDDTARDMAYSESVGKAVSNRLTESVQTQAWEMSELGLISPAAYKRAVDDSTSYTRLPDPYGTGQTLAEAMEYKAEDFELPEEDAYKDTDTIIDKSMLKSNLQNITRKYINTLMRKDILNAVMAVQQQGVSVVGYSIEVVQDEMNSYERHSITIRPLRGKQTTVHFMVPIVDADGRFMSNGVTYRMRLQRGDLPIRKVARARVALTSYYNKTFVMRSSRVINDFDKWMLRTITALAMDAEDSSITDARYFNGLDTEYKLPRMYTLIAQRFSQFTSKDLTFFFNWPLRHEFFEKQGRPIYGEEFTEGFYPVGVITKAKTLILMDNNNTLYKEAYDGNDMEVLGTLMDVLGIDTTGAPIEAASMSVSNRELPVGLVMGFQFGLSKLIEMLGATVSRHQRGERLNMGPDDYALVFQDEVRVFSKLDYRATLILNGLNLYHRSLKRFSVWDFDKPDVYYRILEEAGMGVRYLREMETLFQAWVDPITRGILEQMGEPTEFGPLTVRAVEMLMDDFAPSEIDPAFMRYRGYERFAGTIYSELTRAVKMQKARGGSEQPIEMKPHEIWQRLVQDPSVALVEESNPIANLREQEAMTYRGDGGRSGKSMVERTRVYHDNDQGTVSESTVDSGDVGVIAYLTPDPNFTNMRGQTRRLEADDPRSKLLSSSALLAPCSDNDDNKRRNFIAIQQQQGIYANGYEPTPLRTGYEQIIAQRTTGKYFAKSAAQKGEVVSITNGVLIVRYEDGTEERIELGLQHGTATGVTYSHQMTTTLKPGDTFEKGDTLVYNSKYFQPDRMTPGQVVWKAGVMATVALIDCTDTLEDGSAISENLAEKLTTQITEVRVIQVGFEQAVHDLVKVGEHVDLDSILCTIEDPETADSTLFGEAALDTLKRLQRPTPRAKVVGTVSRIECYYHGDFEDLSENLQGLARTFDRQRKVKAKAMGKPSYTGEVDTSFRIRGKALDPDILALKIYIDHDMVMGVGDKAVVGNQMKTVVSRTFTGVNRVVDGPDIDAIFGRTSIEERIVHSPVKAGKTNMLLTVGSKHIAAVYRGTANERASRKS